MVPKTALVLIHTKSFKRARYLNPTARTDYPSHLINMGLSKSVLRRRARRACPTSPNVSSLDSVAADRTLSESANIGTGARDRVLDTTELLEQILLYLDMQTLLVSIMRVCRLWNKVITESPALRKALFLLPEGDCDASVGDAIINPLLARHFPPFFTPVYDIGCPFPIQSLEPEEGCYDYLFEDMSYNGMSNFKSLPVYKRSIANDDFVEEYGDTPNAKARENNPYLRECASWRKMLTSQPPAKRLGFCMLSTGGYNTITRTEMLYIKCSEDGGVNVCRSTNLTASKNPPLRMANLYAFVWLRMKIGSKNCGFRILRNVRSHTRDYVTQYASLPFYPRFDWFEDKIGALYDEGADIVLQQVIRPMGCCLMGSDPGADAVWRRCHPENIQSDLHSDTISYRSTR